MHIVKMGPKGARGYDCATAKLACIIRGCAQRITPSFMEENHADLCAELAVNFTDFDGELDWLKIRNALQHTLRNGLELELQYIQNRLVAKLGHAIEKSHSVVTPKLLMRKCKGLYLQLQRCFVDENGLIDWYVIKQCLQAEQRKKFEFRRTKTSSLKELKELLSKKGAGKISSRRIKKLDAGLYDFLRVNFKNSRGYIDWQFIMGQMCEEVTARFKFPVRMNRVYPAKSYEDVQELEDAIGFNRRFLYTFFQAERGAEFEKRNEICLALIKLAKKGNMLAEKDLLSLVEFLLEGWAEKIPKFGAFKFQRGEGVEVVRRCIYNYQEIGPFVGYVHKSLQKAALGMPRAYEIVFNEDLAYADRVRLGL